MDSSTHLVKIYDHPSLNASTPKHNNEEITPTSFVEGISLDTLLKYFSNVVSKGDLYNPNKIGEQQQQEKQDEGEEEENEEEKENNKNSKNSSNTLFSSLESSIPMSHSNSILQMKLLIWKYLKDTLEFSFNTLNSSSDTDQSAADKNSSQDYDLDQDGIRDEHSSSASTTPSNQINDATKSIGSGSITRNDSSIKSIEMFLTCIMELITSKMPELKIKGYEMMQEYLQSMSIGSLGEVSEQIITKIVDLLINVVENGQADQERIIASTTLISLIVARNSQSLTLKIIQFILSSKYQSLLPSNLQKTNNQTIPFEKVSYKISHCYEFQNIHHLNNLASSISSIYSMTTNGTCIFIHCNIGLLKLSMHSSTKQYTIDVHKKSFHTSPCKGSSCDKLNGIHMNGAASSEEGSSSSNSKVSKEVIKKSWMLILRDRLYFRSLDMDDGLICILTLDTLEDSYLSIEGELSHHQLGRFPYTLFSDAINQRIGVLEFIDNRSDDYLPATSIRYIKVYDDHTLHVDTTFADAPSAAKNIELFSTKSQVQQFNNVILNQESDCNILKTLELYNISKIFASSRGGLFFQTKESNVYFLGSNGIITGGDRPTSLYSGDGWKQFKKIIWKEPEVLFLDEKGELFSLIAPKKRDPSQLKQYYSKNKVSDAIYYKYGPIVYCKDEQELYALDKAAPTVSQTKIANANVTIMAASDNDFYYVDGSTKKLHSVVLDGKWDVQEVTGVDGEILHLHASYQSVIIVTDNGIYVKGSNTFGQLGLGNYKDHPSGFVKIEHLPPQLDLQSIFKVDSGLTFTLIATKKNQIFYSGNIKDHKQTNSFIQMVDFSNDGHNSSNSLSSTNNNYAKLIDISCTEYGFTILREIYDVNGIQDIGNQFYNFNVYHQNPQVLGIFLPFFEQVPSNNNISNNNNNNNASLMIEKNQKFKLFNQQLQLLDEITVDKKDQVKIFDRPFHLSPFTSFIFDNESKNILVIENVEQDRDSESSSSSSSSSNDITFYNSKHLIDPLVLVNSLLSIIHKNQKPAKQPTKIPIMESKFIASLPNFCFMVPSKTINSSTSSTISFIRVNHPILLKTIVIPKYKEICLSYRIESSDGKQLISTPKKNYKTNNIDLSTPFEMRPGILYRIYFITQESNMSIQGMNYQNYSVAGIKIDMRPPKVYTDNAQILCGIRFSVLPSNSIYIMNEQYVNNDSNNKKSLDELDLKNLFDCVCSMWRQYIGTIQSLYTFEQKDQSKTSLLGLLEQPLPRAISLLADNIATISKDDGLFDDFINFLHQIYCNSNLFRYGSQANSLLFHSVMTQVNKLFTASFSLVYSSSREKVGCIYLLDQLLQVAPKNLINKEIPGIKYLLTSAISSLAGNNKNNKEELKFLTQVQCEDDAFIHEETNPVLVNFYGNIQNIIYKEKNNTSSSSKQKVKIDDVYHGDNLFINLLLSIASRIRVSSKQNLRISQDDNDHHDDDDDDDEEDVDDKLGDITNFKLASNILLETIWSSTLTLKTVGKTFDPPPQYDVSRFGSTSSSWIYEDLIDSITFSVDRTIYVTGVGLYGDKGSYNVQVAHLYGKNAAKFRKGESSPNTVSAQWHNQTTRYIHKILFPSAVILHPGEFLTVCAKINGPSSSSGYRGKDRVPSNGVVFNFTASNVASHDNGTSVSSGQFPSIYFQLEPNRSNVRTTIDKQECLDFTSKVVQYSQRYFKNLVPSSSSSSYLDTLSPTLIGQILKQDYFIQTVTPLMIDSYYRFENNTKEKISQFLQLLEPVTRINKHFIVHQQSNNHNTQVINSPYQQASTSSTIPFIQCIKMESSHPYEECSKLTNVLEFPKSVKWMVIQFDQRSSTLNESDRLIIWTKDDFSQSVESTKSPTGFFKKSFPKLSILVPGNRLVFDFQTASIPNNNNNANAALRYGYSCNVFGYESLGEDASIPLSCLERQLSFYLAQLVSEPLVSNVPYPCKSNKKNENKQQDKDKKAVKPKPKKKKNRGDWNDSESSSSDSSDQEQEDDEDQQDLVEDANHKEFDDFDNFKISSSASISNNENGSTEKSKQFFENVWEQVSSQVYSTKASSGLKCPITDPQQLEFIQDFLLPEPTTPLVQELHQFFNTIGYAVSDNPKAEVDADKKQKKKKDQEKEKVQEDDNKVENKDSPNLDDKGEVNKDEKGQDDKQSEKDDKIKERMKTFPINNEDLSTLDRKTRLKQLKILIDRKKEQHRLWENKKKNFAYNAQAGDDDDDSEESSSSSSDSSSEDERGDVVDAAEESDDEFFNLNEDEELEENQPEHQSDAEKIGDEVKVETEVKVDDIENQDNDEKESDDDKDNDKPEGDDKDKESSAKEEDEDKPSSSAPIAMSQQPDVQSPTIEIISTFKKIQGWDEAVRSLFIEMLRITGATGDFIKEVTNIKHHKKSFEEAKSSDSFEPFVSLWRSIQRKLHNWAETQDLEDTPYEGVSSLFGDTEYFEDTQEGDKKLPFEKIKFILELYSTLEPIPADTTPAAPVDDSPSSSTSSRMIQYSFEELMNSSNLNHSNFKITQPLSAASINQSSLSRNIRLQTSKALLSLLEDKMQNIDFIKIIKDHDEKNRSKVEAIQTWVKLIEIVQSPSALENVIWMLATVLHSKQASKESLPPDWQGRVANNLLLSSKIHPLCKKEFVVYLHALLETISKRINSNMYYFNDNIILNALQCFSMYLLPEDIDFVQKSEIFPLISKILSEVRATTSTSTSTPPTPVFRGGSSKGKEKEGSDDVDLLISTPSATASAISLSSPFNQTVPSNGVQNSCFANISSKCKVVLSKSPEMMPSLFDNSTLTFWEASPKSTITMTLDKAQPVQEVALYIDNVADKDYIVTCVKVVASSVNKEIVKSKDLQFNFCGWVSIPLNDVVSSFVVSFESPSNVRIYQVKVLVPEKTSVMNLVPSSKFEAALNLLKLLTFQIFGITVQQQEKDKDKDKDQQQPLQQIKNHVFGLISGTSGIGNIQKQIFSLISTEVQKEINHLDNCGWEKDEKETKDNEQLLQEPQKEDVGEQKEKKDHASSGEQNYLFELLTTLSSLLESEEGKSFLPSKSSIYSLLPLIHHGQERIQHICINICRIMLVNVKPSLFDNFIKENQSPFIRSLGSFVEYLLLVISKGIQLQVKGQSKENSSNNKSSLELVTFDQLLPKVLDGVVTNEVSKELIEMLKELSTKSQPWKEAINQALGDFIIDMKKQTLLPTSQYLVKTSFWASLASLLVVAGNNEMIQSINTNDANEDSSKIKLCQNHDDGFTEATLHCQSCEPTSNLCNECDRIIHLSKAKRDHSRAALASDSITIQVHESCIRLKLATSLFVVDVEKQKAIVQTTVKSGQEVCRFCKQKLDLENLLPSYGVVNVCSSQDCKQKAQKSCTVIHPCGHYCCGIRDEITCLPCLHGCKNNQQESETTTGAGSSKKLGQDCDDYCMICWTESLSEAPSIQLDCGHVLHFECTKLLLEKRWTGSRITFGFSKCPICKAAIHHTSLESITSVLDNIYNEIIKKGKLRLDFLGIKGDPVFKEGGKYENREEDYIMEQFSYYLCYKCKKPYFGGMNQCAVGLVVPDKINEQDLICGSCSSNDSVTICPKHGKDYLEYKCRYCCSPSVWFCFGTTRFCTVCHDKHAELTSRSKHPQCPVAPGGVQMPGEVCPLGISHPPTGEEFTLGCGLCKYNSQNF